MERLRRHSIEPAAIALWLGTVALYWAAIEVGEAWTSGGRHVPVLWLAAGVGYAVVLAGGWRYALAVGVAALAEGFVGGDGAWRSLLLGLGAAVASLVMAETTRRLAPGPGQLPLETLGRLAAGVAGSAIGATAMLAESRSVDAGAYWPHAFAAQLAGVAIAGPFLRAWLLPTVPGRGSRLQTATTFAASAGMAVLVGSGVLGTGTAALYLIFPPVLWGALRSGMRGLSTTLMTVGIVCATDLALGHGAFGIASDHAYNLDIFLVVLANGALILAGLESDRRTSEASLRANEERFRALIENATDLVSVIARDGTILYESPSAARILGWRADELVGRNLVEFVHPDDLPVLRHALGDVEDRGEAGALIRFRHGDGGWVELQGQARDLSGMPSVGGILVNSRDVTQTHRTELELAAAERRFREFVEALPLVAYVVELGEDGQPARVRPRYVGPEMENLLGYPLSDWLEDPGFAERVIHPDDLADVAARTARAGPGPFDVEYRMVAADGRTVWVLDRRRVVRDERGAATGIEGFLVDVTDRKRLEEQLGRAERMEALGQLAGGVAHDFNNLLTGILGYAELARGQAAAAGLVDDNLDQVLRAAQRASELTRQLLAFGRRQTLDHVVLDLNEVVTETESLLTRLIDENVEIVAELDPDVGPVRADAGQLTQVLVNLAVNARDAMPGGGRLTISTANEVVEEGGDMPAGEYAVVSVADTGEGIPAAVHARLFEPFFTTKPVGKGTGLGLSVVYGIVEQSRGHLVVNSEPGRGAEFRILLPRDGESAPAPAAAVNGKQVEAPRGSETVLLVEDEELVRRLTSAVLERQGYRVLTAASPEEALAVAEPYDLLLTDVVMPGMSGPELARRLLETRAQAVLFTSGYSAAAFAARATLPGALLEKPFTFEQLAVAVRAALDGQQRGV